MSNASEIERGIGQRLSNLSELADIQRIYLGMPYNVPTQFWPYIMVVVDVETTAEVYTGNRLLRVYSGAIVVNLIHQDIPETVLGKIVRVPSYSDMRDWVEAIKHDLQAAQTLPEATIENGFIRTVQIGEQAIQYGLAAEVDRPDAYINFAVIPFDVEVVEAQNG